MGRRISEDQKEDTKGYGNERTDNKTTCKGKPGRRQQSKVPEATTADLIKLTLDHFFPDFNVYLNQLPDPRRQDRITYSKEHLFYLGLSMFLFHCGSRNQLESERKTIDFYRNLLTLSKTEEEYTASTDAMNYFMKAMNPMGGLELLPGKLVNNLIRSRVLDKYRNSHGEFMIAVDGVHLLTKKGEHSGAVYKNHGDERHSYYSALEAKLVTENGMGFSLATVFIENEEEYNKQDCETKAFYRLGEILKKRFSRLQMCLLFDGLYLNKNVLDICDRNRWGYYITLKDGSAPKLYDDAMRQIRRRPHQAIDHQTEPGIYQHISWTENMKYNGSRTYVLVCEETKLTKDGIETNRFVWLTDTRPTKDNAAQLVKEARCRWQIEEAFNIQKNGGYELEHNFGTVGFAMKNYYYLLQIAHMLHQLMIRSDLFPNLQKKFILHEFKGLPDKIKVYLAAMAKNTLEYFRTIKNFVKRLAESFRNHQFSGLVTDANISGTIRIRLDSS